MVQMIQLYLPGDPHPRGLLIAEGRAEMDRARTVLLAQYLSAQQQGQFLHAIADRGGYSAGQSLAEIFQFSLQSAIVAFENAAATSPSAPPLEMPSAMEPTVMLGDAFYAAGDEEEAKNAYAEAIRSKFTEEYEPSDELLWLARATARWAVLLFNEGVCKTSSPRITDWDAAWIPLGATPDHDLCRLAQPDLRPPAELAKFGVMGLVYPLIAESVQKCASHDPAAAGSTTTAADRMKLIDCLRSTGPEAYLRAPRQLQAKSSADTDLKIANFLSRSPH
jgi:tetratricopeptide (TPR) repeat protein